MTPFCSTYPIVTDPEAKERARQMYTPYSINEYYIVSHGGSSWGAPSFSPRTGLIYVSGKDGSIAFTVNPVALVWQQTASSNSAIGASGNLVTAGDLVLQGTDVGEFYALDARTGDELFVYQHNRPIRASPLTYEVDGKQYMSVVSTNEVLTFSLP